MERALLFNTPASSSSAQEPARVLECNICWVPPIEPVLTCCGHLFCWPCLYFWLHRGGGSQTCPICRINVREDMSITPIYGSQGTGNAFADQSSAAADNVIPPRPTPPFTESLESLEFPYGSGRFVFRRAALEEIDILLAEMEGLRTEVDKLRTQLNVHRGRLNVLERESICTARLESDQGLRRPRST